MSHYLCAILKLLVISVLFEISTCVSVIETVTHSLQSDYSGVLSERYFQVLNYPNPNSTVIRPPTDIEMGDRFGESIDGFRHRDSRHVLVGAPHKKNKSGATYLCSYKQQYHHSFLCETKLTVKLPLKNSSVNGILLGSSVSAVTTLTGQGILMYCAQLYHEGDAYKGICNFSPYEELKHPKAIKPCNYGNCLAGFTSRLAISATAKNDVIIAVGGPMLHKSNGRVYMTSVDVGKDYSSFQYHHSHRRPDDHVFYRGYALDLGYSISKSENKNVLFMSMPYDNHYQKAKVELLCYSKVEGLTSDDSISRVVEERVNEGFGISLTAVNFEASTKSRLDFLVGEPFYNDKETGRYDVGRVLVYCNQFRNKRSAIVGPEANGRFGSSIARIPDINGDLRDEFVIGCPYCDNGKGIVFFFFGKEDCVFKTPDQIIRASDLMSHYGNVINLKSFGMSLSGNVDADNNGLNDLIIGSPKSNAIVLARTRNVLEVSHWDFKPMNGYCKVETDKSSVTCELHLSITLKPLKSTPRIDYRNLRLGVRFSFDTEKKNMKRLMYNNTFEVNYSLPLDSGDGGLEAYMTLEKKYFGIQKTNLKYDKSTPLIIRLSIEYLKGTTATLGSLSDTFMYPFPRLVQPTEKIKVNVDLTSTTCGNNNCKNDFAVEVSTDRYPTNSFEYGTSNVTLIVHVRNLMTSVDPHCVLKLYFDNGLSLMRIQTDSDVQPTCTSIGNIEECDLSNAMTSSSVIRLQIDMDAMKFTRRAHWSNMATGGPPSLRAKVFTTTNDINMTNNEDIFNFTVTYSPSVILTPEIVKPTLLDERNTSYRVRKRERIHSLRIGPRLQHVYQLVNMGSFTVYDILLNITTPITTEFGERLLYISNQTRSGGNIYPAGPRILSKSGKSFGNCTVPDEWMNPLDLTIVTDEVTSRRVRRSVANKISTAAFSIDSQTSSQETKGKSRIACGEDAKYFSYPRCIVIQCVVGQLVARDVVTIEMEGWVWSETVQKRYVSDLSFETNVEGQIQGIPPFADPSNISNIILARANQSTNVVFPNFTKPAKYQLPIWIIIAAVIAGILLLGLIVICLKKVGFFKRRRRPYATHGCHFEKYGSSNDVMRRSHESADNMLAADDWENESEEKISLPNDGSLQFVCEQPGFTDMNRQPGSIDTGISEAHTSSSNPSQALDTHDCGYESPSHGLSDHSN